MERTEAWYLDEIDYDMSIIGFTWAFKLNRFSDGLINKFKSRFCARKNQNLEGAYFFETYAPIVQWTTICLKIILEVLFGLKYKQEDVTVAFLHEDFEKVENSYT